MVAHTVARNTPAVVQHLYCFLCLFALTSCVRGPKPPANFRGKFSNKKCRPDLLKSQINNKTDGDFNKRRWHWDVFTTNDTAATKATTVSNSKQITGRGNTAERG